MSEEIPIMEHNGLGSSGAERGVHPTPDRAIAKGGIESIPSPSSQSTKEIRKHVAR